jgi:hypothetical protein
MLEHETDAILATLSGRTIGERETILLREILAADVPRGIKTYLQAETVRFLEAELFSSPKFSRVDRDSPGVRRHGRAFIVSMSALYCFPRAEYLALLENAVLFLENYLCRPQWTIENFVFESGGRMSAQDVVSKLDCTVDYAYFRTLIQKVMQRRGTRDVSAEEFRAMLVRIDDQIVKQHNARELALLAKPIFDFLLLRDTPPDVSIPLKPILVFFEDKRMNILRDYIESICRIRQRTEITLDELTTLVEDLYLGQSDPAGADTAAAPAGDPSPVADGEQELTAEEFHPPEKEPDTGTQDQTPPTPSIETESTPEEEILLPGEELPGEESPGEEPPGEEPPGEEPAGEESPGEEPPRPLQAPSLFDFVTEEPDGRDDSALQDQVRPLRPAPPPVRKSSPPPPIQNDNPGAGKPRTPEPYERLFGGTEPSGELTDLHEMIHGHTRSMFVRRLFDRDENRYEDVITSLNNSRTWREAALLLNSLYTAHGLDPFDPDVVEFTDVIHRRYLDAEKNGS